MRTFALTVAVLLVALVTPGVDAGMYSKKSGVVNLTAKTFNSVVSEPDTVTLVEFYAPWCGHCKALTPKWINAASRLQGVVTVAAIDCDEQQNKSIASKYGIKGFPTIKVFKGSSKAPQDYQGAREADAIVSFAKGLAPNLVAAVMDKHLSR
jgi:protein disulfide-isomerase A6